MTAPTAPPPWKAAIESLAGLEVGAFALRWPEVRRWPRGDGGPVLVAPGFSGGDASTLVLRRTLRALNHDAIGWGLGSNVGDVPQTIELLRAQVEQLAVSSGRPVALVGWSLGGYMVREVARAAPDTVRRVVTLGSPIVGGPRYTQIANLYRLQGYDLEEIEMEIRRREQEAPIEVPVTAIYSRLDGIVDWRACVDHVEPRTENVEIRATHLGMGASLPALRIVADRLATPT